MGWAHCFKCGANHLAGQACTCPPGESGHYEMTKTITVPIIPIDPEHNKLMDKFMAKDRTSSPIEQPIYIASVWMMAGTRTNQGPGNPIFLYADNTYAGHDKTKALQSLLDFNKNLPDGVNNEWYRGQIETWVNGKCDTDDEWINFNDYT